MNYLEQCKKYFERLVIQTEQSLQFDNSFDIAIYFLVFKFLASDSKGPCYIEVPVKELGAKNHLLNYRNFLSSIFHAVSEFTLSGLHSKILQKEKIEVGDFFIDSNGNLKTMIAENQVKVFSEIKTKDNSVYTVKPGYEAIKVLNEFNYNRDNGQRSVNNFINWIKENKKLCDNQVIGTNYKILILSHLEIEKSVFNKAIPYCTIKDNGELEYSSPIPPIFFLARDHTNIKARELVRSKFFNAIIMAGDKKISSLDEWAITNNYFEKIIYIGSKSPYSKDAYFDLELSYRYFTFSTNEIHHYYGIKKNITFERENFSIEGLGNLIQDFYNELKNLDPNLRFDLSRFYDLTSEISETQFHWFLDYFDQKIAINGNYEIDYSLLKKKYESILTYFKMGGNSEKIKAFEALRGKYTTKRSEIIPVVLNKHEVSNLANQLNINQSKILTIENFGRKLRNSKSEILESSKDLIFIFFSIPTAYSNSLINALDLYSVPGKRIFLTTGIYDQRIIKVLQERNNFNRIRLENPVREEITHIVFQPDGIFEEVDSISVIESIEDLELNDYINFVPKSKGYQREFYNVQLSSFKEHFELAGKVVDAEQVELVDLSEVEAGNQIIFYQHNSDVFEKIWELRYPGFSEDIQKYSEIMRDLVSKLIIYYDNNSEKLHKELKSSGLKTSMNSTKRLVKDDDHTLFPRLDTLKAIKISCEEIGEFKTHPFIKEFQMILKAKKGVELRKHLGNRLSNCLLDKFCGFEIEDYELNKLFKDNPEILKLSLEKSIIVGEILNIKKSKKKE